MHSKKITNTLSNTFSFYYHCHLEYLLLLKHHVTVLKHPATFCRPHCLNFHLPSFDTRNTLNLSVAPSYIYLSFPLAFKQKQKQKPIVNLHTNKNNYLYYLFVQENFNFVPFNCKNTFSFASMGISSLGLKSSTVNGEITLVSLTIVVRRTFERTSLR